MMMHLALDKLVLWGSPSEFWCYGDEDACGKVKKVAAKSSHPATIEKRVMEKLMVLAGLKAYDADVDALVLDAMSDIDD